MKQKVKRCIRRYQWFLIRCVIKASSTGKHHNHVNFIGWHGYYGMLSVHMGLQEDINFRQEVCYKVTRYWGLLSLQAKRTH